MKQVFLSGDGQVEVLDVPLPGHMRGAALVQNGYSLISTGTEGSSLTRRGGVLGLYEKARKSSDRVGQVWDMAKRQGVLSTARLVQQKLTDSTPLGYSCAGRVVDVDSGELPFQVGDLVACMGTGFATHSEFVTVPKNLMAKIPAGVALEDASFAALACIAMQGIRRLELTPGEIVGVVGLGLIGQLCVRLLIALGYRAVGLDLSADRVARARSVEGVAAWTPDDTDSAFRCRELTGGAGLDGVIICAAAKSSDPVNQAFDMCRKGGRVALVGVVGLELVREKMYAKELELRLSSSYGPGRYDADYELEGRDYPIAYARWTEQRSLQLFLDLLAGKRLSISDLVSGRYEIAQANDAYAQVKSASPQTYGIVFDYRLPKEIGPPPPATERTIVGPRPATIGTGHRLRIGLIGVGAYAKAVHIPNLQALSSDFSIDAVASRTGGTAAIAGRKVGARIVSSDYRALLDDKDIDAVLISTRHASHGRMVADALDAGKHVFVEKPMTTTVEDGERIVAKAKQTGLTVRVGFNRRFSGHLGVLKRMLADAGRRMFTMRVNIGDVGTHWSNDTEEGGRILGEGVHFIDLANWMFEAGPLRVAAVAAGEASVTNPNIAMTLTYPGGAVAQLLYTSLGSPDMGKELFEAFAGGKSGYCRDFIDLAIFPRGQGTPPLIKGDKGQKEALREFALAVRGQHHPVKGADAEAGLLATRIALEAGRIAQAA